MHWNRALFALLVASAVALAGCTQETDTGTPGGDGADDGTQFNTAEVTFDGTATGPVSETVECAEGSAQLSVTGEITNGTANVTVMDGNNTEVFQQTFGANDTIAIEGELLEGGNGTWTVQVMSEGNMTGGDGTGQGTGQGTEQQVTFQGEIEVRLVC